MAIMHSSACMAMFLRRLTLWFSRLRCCFQLKLYAYKAFSDPWALKRLSTRRNSASAGFWFDGYCWLHSMGVYAPSKLSV
jgi:hypothetical protein